MVIHRVEHLISLDPSNPDNAITLFSLLESIPKSATVLLVGWGLCAHVTTNFAGTPFVVFLRLPEHALK